MLGYFEYPTAGREHRVAERVGDHIYQIGYNTPWVGVIDLATKEYSEYPMLLSGSPVSRPFLVAGVWGTQIFLPSHNQAVCGVLDTATGTYSEFSIASRQRRWSYQVGHRLYTIPFGMSGSPACGVLDMSNASYSEIPLQPFGPLGRVHAGPGLHGDVLHFAVTDDLRTFLYRVDTSTDTALPREEVPSDWSLGVATDFPITIGDTIYWIGGGPNRPGNPYDYGVYFDTSTNLHHLLPTQGSDLGQAVVVPDDNARFWVNRSLGGTNTMSTFDPTTKSWGAVPLEPALPPATTPLSRSILVDSELFMLPTGLGSAGKEYFGVVQDAPYSPPRRTARGLGLVRGIRG